MKTLSIKVKVTNKRESGLGPVFDAEIQIAPSAVLRGTVTLDLDEPGFGIEAALDVRIRRFLKEDAATWVRGALERAAERVRDGADAAGGSLAFNVDDALVAACVAEQRVEDDRQDAAVSARLALLERIWTMSALELLTYVVRDGGARVLAASAGDNAYDPAIEEVVMARTAELRLEALS